MDRARDQQLLERVQQLQEVADGLGITLAQLAIAWVLQNPNVSAALVGASRPEQLEDSVKASGVVLDAEVLSAIDAALAPVAVTDPEETYSVSPASRPL